MTNGSNAMAHPDEAELIRWIDRALDPAERTAIENHVAGCAECAASRAAIERRLARLSGLLRAVDVRAPASALRVRVTPAVARFSRWRVAAVLALMAGGALSVRPVRAWFVSVARSVWSNPAPVDLATPDAGAVGFVPSGPTLTIRVPSRADSRLTVEVIDGDRAVVVGNRGQAVPGLVVLPTELRIGEPADSIADYVVRVPLRLETVRILIGNSAPRVYRPSAPGERWTIPLTP